MLVADRCNTRGTRRLPDRAVACPQVRNTSVIVRRPSTCRRYGSYADFWWGIFQRIAKTATFTPVKASAA
jgi:hypothetical protein